MHITTCTPTHLPLLARLNRELIEDEGSDNPMSLAQLEERMRGFICGDYRAYLFREEEVVGYALVDLTKKPPYLRQFYICRDARRRHCGRRAFYALLELLGCESLDCEVLSGNAAGIAFWESLGFRERSRYLRLEGTVKRGE